MSVISLRRLDERVTNIELAAGEAPRQATIISNDDNNGISEDGDEKKSRFAGGVAAAKERKRIQLNGYRQASTAVSMASMPSLSVTHTPHLASALTRNMLLR